MPVTETIPDYLIGRTVTCTILPATNTSGALSTGTLTASPLTNTLESIDYLSDPEEIEASGMAAGRRNYINLKEDNMYTLTELMQTATGDVTAGGGSTSNILRGWALAGAYGYLIVSAGGQSFKFWGKRGRYTEHHDKGVSRATLVMRYIGTASANPTVTTP